MATVYIDSDELDYALIVSEDTTQRVTLSLKNEDAVQLLTALQARYGKVEFAPLPRSKKGFFQRVKEVFYADRDDT